MYLDGTFLGLEKEKKGANHIGRNLPSLCALVTLYGTKREGILYGVSSTSGFAGLVWVSS